MSDIHLSDDRYHAALVRQRDRIAEGIELEAIDSTTPGDKYTHASWGLCSRDAEAWPDREDHLWPDQFDRGRVAPLYRERHQRCPMDTRPDGTLGCFYDCRILKRKHATPSREEAVALYDAQIEATTRTD